jgi:hypothetical protein
VLLIAIAMFFGFASSTRHTRSAGAVVPVEGKVAVLLAGIPQHGNALGSPRAPVTLQVFGDLECVDVRHWFMWYLPAVINEFVRTNILRLEYRALKTDTLNPQVFVVQQTAALAAGRQDKMWNFLATFYYEQGTEYTSYVTERYLDGIVQQVPGLSPARWNSDRVIPLAKTVVSDDHTARALGFHDTPAFRIGHTGGNLRNFSGRNIVIYTRYHYKLSPTGAPVVIPKPNGYMNPVSLINAQDIKKAIDGL